MAEDSNPTTITIDLPHDLLAAKVRGKVMKVNVTKFPNNALVAIFLKGNSRIWNDAIGGVGDTDLEKQVAAEAMLARFYAGDVTATRTSTPGLTAMEDETAKEGMGKFKAAYGEAWKVDFRDTTTRQKREAVLEWLAESGREKIRAKCEKIAAMRLEDDDDFDMPDIPDAADES